jgi:Na+-transporting NADH:ubiquinone oxidoreductase subunit B
MRRLRAWLDRQAVHFEKGGRLEKLHVLHEAADTFLYTPPSVTGTAAHVRDAIDLKRMMMVVVVAALPCVLMAMYNTGLQANLALDPAQTGALEGWRHALIRTLGVGYSPNSVLACTVHGALYFLPLYVVTMLVGGAWEVLFAAIRRHPINEGFLVTGLLFPLTLPPTTPLWQAALGISFGVVVAKELFGGTGMNFINPALAARAFLFFAYPAEITGDAVWIAAPPALTVDGHSGATVLAELRVMTAPFAEQPISWWTAFVGLEPGSMGETSALACLLGAALLVVTRIASWRVMAGVALGTIGMSLVFNAFASPAHPYFAIPFWWHMVLGGWAFGTVFMATDPVTAPFSERGKWIYGALIGVFIVLVRTVNPAYPESTMLVILFMNVMAPLIDYGFVKANVNRRARRLAER